MNAPSLLDLIHNPSEINPPANTSLPLLPTASPLIPPQPFHLTNADLVFTMQLPPFSPHPHPNPQPQPLPPYDRLTRSVAMGALRVFHTLVQEYGGVECDFAIGDREGEGEEVVKARFEVRFLDAVG